MFKYMIIGLKQYQNINRILFNCVITQICDKTFQSEVWIACFAPSSAPSRLPIHL